MDQETTPFLHHGCESDVAVGPQQANLPGSQEDVLHKNLQAMAAANGTTAVTLGRDLGERTFHTIARSVDGFLEEPSGCLECLTKLAESTDPAMSALLESAGVPPLQIRQRRLGLLQMDAESLPPVGVIEGIVDACGNLFHQKLIAEIHHEDCLISVYFVDEVYLRG